MKPNNNVTQFKRNSSTNWFSHYVIAITKFPTLVLPHIAFTSDESSLIRHSKFCLTLRNINKLFDQLKLSLSLFLPFCFLLLVPQTMENPSHVHVTPNPSIHPTFFTLWQHTEKLSHLQNWLMCAYPCWIHILDYIIIIISSSLTKNQQFVVVPRWDKIQVER